MTSVMNVVYNIIEILNRNNSKRNTVSAGHIIYPRIKRITCRVRTNFNILFKYFLKPLPRGYSGRCRRSKNIVYNINKTET